VALVVPYTFHKAGRDVLKTQHPWLQLTRGTLVVIASIIFITGLQFLPIADASAINFVWPLLITLFSIPLLGEKVGIRRLSATVVGFIGMLLIVRPGSSAFQWAAVYPLAAAVLWALASVLTRKMAATEKGETTIVWSALISLLVSGLLLPFVFVPPGGNALLLGMIIGLVSAIGHSVLIYAFERAPASTLAPYTYIQLVWATLFGFLVFGTIPDAWKFAGGALITASGIYTAHREHVRRKEAEASHLQI
jgi:drug/metabolite transporter (DMT)-like permease